MVSLLFIFSICWQRSLSVPLSEFYPFGPDVDSTIGPTLDGSSNATVDIEFPFYDNIYSSLFVRRISYWPILITDIFSLG